MFAGKKDCSDVALRLFVREIQQKLLELYWDLNMYFGIRILKHR